MNKFLLKYWGNPIIKYILLLIYILRFIVPFLIFNFPVFSLISEYILDYGDSLLGFYSKSFSWKFCYRMDKFLDYWFYIFVLIYCYHFFSFPVLLALFVYRSAGQFLTMKSYNERLLLPFANFFDLYFMVFVLSRFVPQIFFLFHGLNNIILLLILSPIAVGREYLIHFRKPIPKLFRTQWWNWKKGYAYNR